MTQEKRDAWGAFLGSVLKSGQTEYRVLEKLRSGGAVTLTEEEKQWLLSRLKSDG